MRNHGVTDFKGQPQVQSLGGAVLLSFKAMFTSSHPVQAAPKYESFALPHINLKPHNT